jgi:hypothetical protein
MKTRKLPSRLTGRQAAITLSDFRSGKDRCFMLSYTVKYLFIFLFVLFFLYPTGGAFGYREVYTSLGKVIVELDREKALEKFGIPDAAGNNLWRYNSPEQFFVYFSGNSLLNIYLYPQFSETTVGSTLELKVYGYFSDLTIKDVTSAVQILVDQKWNFDFTKTGVIIPLKEGKYQVMAKYGNIFSNPCQVVVKNPLIPEDKKVQEKERCLGINVIPYNPRVTPGVKWEFKALGTFFDSEQGTYSIKDITREVWWFVKKNQALSGLKDNHIKFSLSAGKQSVFCNYRELESFPQEVSVSDTPITSEPVLKHITLLPEFLFAPIGGSFNLRAFATYDNNYTKEITHLVRWKLSNKDTLAASGSGNFSAVFVGICDVVVEKDNVQSIPAKIVVTSQRGREAFREVSVKEAQKNKKEREPDSDSGNPDDLVKKIKDEAENLSEDFFREEKRLKLIRIEPVSFNIPLGGSTQAVALGLYSDNTEEDLTMSGEWKTSDDKVFGVAAGKITTRNSGEARLYVRFKEIISPPAQVIVEGPKLVSIIASAANSRISMRGSTLLKAEGLFSDSSRKDITSMVTWAVTGGVVKVKNATAYPLKIGKAQIFAQYADIKSLPVDIRVIFNFAWLFEVLLKIAALLILASGLVLVVFYFITHYKINKMTATLHKDPRSFIISLYKNAKEVLGIFGFQQKDVLPPLTFAGLVDAKYSIKTYYYSVYAGLLGLKKNASEDEVRKKYGELALRYHSDKAKPKKFEEIHSAFDRLSKPQSNRTFINFTMRFEEAKYSTHSFALQDALSILSEYNYFIRIMLSYCNKPELFFRYCLTLLKTRPLYI